MGKQNTLKGIRNALKAVMKQRGKNFRRQKAQILVHDGEHR